MPAAHETTFAAKMEDDNTKSRQNTTNIPPLSIDHLVHRLEPLPSSELTDPLDDVTLPRLVEALQSRQSIRQMMLQVHCRAADSLKSMLQQLDSETLSRDALIQEQNGKLAEGEKIIQGNRAAIESLEKRNKMQEHQIEILQKTTEIYEEERFFLQQELESREQQLRRELADKRRVEQHLNSVVKDTQLKWEKECERRVNAVILEMQRKLRLKEELLNQLRAVVMDSEAGAEHQPRQKHKQEPMPEAEETLPEQKLGSSTPLPDSVVHPGPRLSPDISFNVEQDERGSSPACHILTADARGGVSVTRYNSACDLQGSPESPTEYYSFHSPGMNQSSTGSSLRKGRRGRRWSVKKEDPKVSPLEKNEGSKQRETPVRPLHRRFSSRKKILDHTPSSSLDLGTVLQPNIPNAVKVCSPSEKDLSKCERYVLTHQELVSDGEIRTKLIKGEVLKTRGGGRAVLFTDIETLKQELTPAPR